MKSEQKTVLVTGAANGIGRAISLYLAEKGDIVIACDIDQQGLEQFNNIENIKPYYMNVTEPESIVQVVEKVNKEFKGLDCLVNDAGLYLGGPLTEVDNDALLLSLKVNVFGTFLVTKYCFPLLREKKGRIINLSSEVGRIAFPFNGPYSMTKYAIEAFSDSLRREMQLFGIKVIILQPGAVKTQLLDKTKELFVKHLDGDYGHAVAKALAYLEKDQRKGAEPELIAKKIYRILHMKHPKLRYKIKNSRSRRILEFLPSKIVDWLIKMVMLK